MAQGNGRLPPSQIDSAMPGAGIPLEGDEEIEVEVEEEEVEPSEIIENEDGSVSLDFNSVVKEELLAEHDANLADGLDERLLMDLGNELIGLYEEDRESRQEWETSYAEGLKLLGLKYEERDQPFRGSSGVTHPVIAEAVTQFQAQAYKELLPADGPVRTQIIGETTPEVEAQAQRVQQYMNYQIMHNMQEFDPELDRLLFYLPLAGSAFKKIYFDETLDRAVSKFIPADDLVVPYNATDLFSASRVTHVIRMAENEIKKLQAGGFYRDISLEPYELDDELREKEREISGITKTSVDNDCTLIEMHTNIDLEGYEHTEPMEGTETGIKLPYIVTVDLESQQILAVRRNWKEGDEYYKKLEYFAHFKFLPGLGFYGLGLLHMIGGLGRSATSILRQLIDAGTLANLPAGFKARGIRIREPDEPLSPGEFRDIDVPGGALKDSILPLPYKEPSQTLMQLLGFVVDAGRRFAAITDMQVGDGNQSAAVGTTIALLEKGSKVMSAIHKRLHYAQKQEFKMLAKVFAESMPPMYPYNVYGAEAFVKQMDFDDRVDVVPVSDPNIFSMSQRLSLAQMQLQLAQSNPQMHNMYEAYRRMYEAVGVQNIQMILPPPQEPQPTDPSIENARSLIQENLTAFQEQDQDAHIAAHLAFMKAPVVASTPPIFAMLLAHICEHIAFKARGVAMMEAMDQAQQAQMQGIPPPQIDGESRVAILISQYTEEVFSALLPPPEGQVDPLVTLREKELDIKATDIQRKALEFDARMEFEQNREEGRQELTAERITSSEDIAQLRATVAREKMRKDYKVGN
tara:strand:- start:1427 stop:3832 length:2406 start_codon:yes stop_codon:yes gene_type:complete